MELLPEAVDAVLEEITRLFTGSENLVLELDILSRRSGIDLDQLQWAIRHLNYRAVQPFHITEKADQRVRIFLMDAALRPLSRGNGLSEFSL